MKKKITPKSSSFNSEAKFTNSVMSLILVLLFLTITFFTEALNAQIITSFSPGSGPIGTTVTITGNGFNITPTNNVVFFGPVRAAITAATTTSLTATVPVSTTYQNISATNLSNNLTAYSSKPFSVLFPGRITPEFAPKVDFGSGVNPFSVSLGDLNADGKSDMAVANTVSHTVSVFRNTSTEGSVSFASKVDYGTAVYPYSVVTGDLDGDGKPDMATANWGSNNVSVFRNTSTSGTISFAGKIDFNAGVNPHSVTIADFNGDGKPDLVVANINGASISVLRNTSTVGAISFAAKVDFSTGAGTNPATVNTGDLDGDGKPDIASANWYGNTISLFRNTSTAGSISFAARVDFAAFDLPDCVGIGDLDRDGKSDLAISNRGTNSVVTMRNTSTAGTLSFAGRVEFGTGVHPFFVSIGDLDGDGKPDLATPNAGESQIIGNLSVLRNTSVPGTISFDAKVDFVTGDGPNFACIGDLDGDGIPDISITNYSSNNISVLRNKATSTINIKVIPDGLYNSGNDRLNLKDTVRAYLHSNVSPFNVVDSSIALIDSVTFTGRFYFSNAPTGNYYIRIKHRNSLETWSRQGGETFTSGAVMNYDFTSSLSKAYGNNMIQINNAPVRFGIFSGDVNQDGIIDLTDIVYVSNAEIIFLSGYVVTDLNGNYVTDLPDVLIAYNNSLRFATLIKP